MVKAYQIARLSDVKTILNALVITVYHGQRCVTKYGIVQEEQMKPIVLAINAEDNSGATIPVIAFLHTAYVMV